MQIKYTIVHYQLTNIKIEFNNAELDDIKNWVDSNFQLTKFKIEKHNELTPYELEYQKNDISKLLNDVDIYNNPNQTTEKISQLKKAIQQKQRALKRLNNKRNQIIRKNFNLITGLIAILASVLISINILTGGYYTNSKTINTIITKIPKIYLFVYLGLNAINILGAIQTKLDQKDTQVKKTQF